MALLSSALVFNPLVPQKQCSSLRESARFESHSRHLGFPNRLHLPRCAELTVAEPDQDAKSNRELLACPICFEALTRKGPVGLNRRAISRSGFQCTFCKNAYSSRDVFLDLTIAASMTNYEESIPASMELFRNPFVSFVYERGWRQSFSRSGFPGPDKEFNMAQEFLSPAAGGVLLDVSCGSGLFSRRFAKSNTYAAVIASDFSENMLRQCSEYLIADHSLDKLNLALVRADVARLPFASQTIDAVHAGAALHCWPVPSVGMAEISRILRPGGVVVATTFVSSISCSLPDILKPLQQALRRAPSSYRFWLESELEDLCKACGLVNFRKIRKGGFIMISACKPD